MIEALKLPPEPLPGRPQVEERLSRVAGVPQHVPHDRERSTLSVQSGGAGAAQVSHCETGLAESALPGLHGHPDRSSASRDERPLRAVAGQFSDVLDQDRRELHDARVSGDLRLTDVELSTLEVHVGLDLDSGQLEGSNRAHPREAEDRQVLPARREVVARPVRDDALEQGSQLLWGEDLRREAAGGEGACHSPPDLARDIAEADALERHADEAEVLLADCARRVTRLEGGRDVVTQDIDREFVGAQAGPQMPEERGGWVYVPAADGGLREPVAAPLFDEGDDVSGKRAGFVPVPLERANEGCGQLVRHTRILPSRVQGRNPHPLPKGAHRLESETAGGSLSSTGEAEMDVWNGLYGGGGGTPPGVSAAHTRTSRHQHTVDRETSRTRGVRPTWTTSGVSQRRRKERGRSPLSSRGAGRVAGFRTAGEVATGRNATSPLSSLGGAS